MKRLLLPLSLTFLSASCGLSDNSNIYLICSPSQEREYVWQGRETDEPWKNMDKTQIKNNKNILAFTLNERDESGTVSFPKTGLTQKLDVVSFDSESIFTGNSIDDDDDPYHSIYIISRIDGSYLRSWEFHYPEAKIRIETKGTCKTKGSKETLF